MFKSIGVTIIQEVLTEEARKKLDEQQSMQFEDLTCNNGKTREQYDSLGMAVPKDLIEKEKQFTKDNDLDDSDFQEVYQTAFFPLSELKLCVDNTPDAGSTIYLNNGLMIMVEETSDEVHFMVLWETRGRYEKITDSIKNFWVNNYFARQRRINKLKKNQ